MRYIHIALVTASFSLATVAFAQEQATPTSPLNVPAPPAAATPEVPSRGASMEAVRAKFGAPSQESPAVGQPPITRWDYPSYSVFFENDKVLHTVVAKR